MDGTVTIYADILFFINTAADFLCLYITSRIQALPTKTYRLILGSVFGGIYSCISLYFTLLPQILQLMIHILSGIVICLISLGKQRIFSKSALFFTTCALLGGAMCGIYWAAGRKFYVAGGFYVDTDPLFVLVFSGLCSIGAMLYLLTLRKSRKKQAECEFFFQNNLFKAILLCDSGCFIRDSISGYPVIIISSRVLKSIIEVTGANQKSLEALGNTSRLIPVTAVSGTTLLCGFKPDIITVNKKQICAVVAVDPQTQSFGGCDGLLPWELGE